MTRRGYLQLREHITRLEEIAHDMHLLERQMLSGSQPAAHDAAERLRELREQLDKVRDELRRASHGPVGTAPPAGPS